MQYDDKEIGDKDARPTGSKKRANEKARKKV